MEEPAQEPLTSSKCLWGVFQKYLYLKGSGILKQKLRLKSIIAIDLSFMKRQY